MTDTTTDEHAHSHPLPLPVPPTLEPRWGFNLTCPVCGAPVEVVTIGRAVAGTAANAVVRCSACPRPNNEWLLLVRMLPVRENQTPKKLPERSPAACGTPSGYRRHIRLSEPVDEACAAAHRQTVARQAERRRGAGVFV